MVYEQIDRNKRKTYLIFTLFIILLMGISAFVGDFFFNNLYAGLIVGFLITLFYILTTYYQSTSIVMSMNNAKKTSEQENPLLWHIVEDMSMVANIPMPEVYIIDDPSPNAFATGRDPKHSAVAVTSGLLELMNREELEAVIAHEVSHVRNYDIRVSTIAIALSSAIIFLSYMISNMLFWARPMSDDRESNNSNAEIIRLVIWIVGIVFSFLGPMIATLIQFAISRNREYLADASGVELTRNPQGLISALEKLKDNSKPMKKVDESSASLYISTPLKKKQRASLYDTHPPLDERIKRLQDI
ncbi:zinc metalloprotease HtpX [Lactobacillus terrae]|uniref:zinc metalloprotease HtpX n=1 Tax=Lactobacillus terrae TaxID=2269374 RepID=UPI000C1B7246|nr:zinc metalloprotease HtpX [Lactobacillus terrae]